MRNAKLCSPKCEYSEQDYGVDMDQFESDLKDHNPMDYDTDTEQQVLKNKKGKKIDKVLLKKKEVGENRKKYGKNDDY
jgi:hypothetical protein